MAKSEECDVGEWFEYAVQAFARDPQVPAVERPVNLAGCTVTGSARVDPSDASPLPWTWALQALDAPDAQGNQYIARVGVRPPAAGVFCVTVTVDKAAAGFPVIDTFWLTVRAKG